MTVTPPMLRYPLVLDMQSNLTQVSDTWAQLKIQLQLCVYSNPNLNIVFIYSKYAELCV